MPKTLARSVIAKAGMPSAAARATASSMRTIPSVMENSLWSRRWTKAGFGIGLRGTGEAKILPPAPPVRTPEFGPGSKTLLRQQDQMGQFARDGGFHDHDQRHSRARPCAGADAFRRGYRIQVSAPRRQSRLFGRAPAWSKADRPVRAGALAAAAGRGAPRPVATKRGSRGRSRRATRAGARCGRRGNQGGGTGAQRRRRTPASRRGTVTGRTPGQCRRAQQPARPAILRAPAGPRRGGRRGASPSRPRLPHAQRVARVDPAHSVVIPVAFARRVHFSRSERIVAASSVASIPVVALFLDRLRSYVQSIASTGPSTQERSAG